jgi:hypothetical protein
MKHPFEEAMVSVVCDLAGCVDENHCDDRLGDQENLRHIRHTQDYRDDVGVMLHDDGPSLESPNGDGTGLEVSA